MATTYECPYCDWVGTEPDPHTFETYEDWRKALVRFWNQQENHGCNQVES